MSPCVETEASIGGDTAYRCATTGRRWSQRAEATPQCPGPHPASAPTPRATWGEIVASIPYGATIELSPEERAARDRAQAEIQAARARSAWESRATAGGIPRRYWDVCFETARPTAAILALQQFAGAGLPAGRCGVLMGATGTGKTYASVALLRSATRFGWRFWYFPALVGAWLDSDRRADALRSALHTELVVLDDFGAEYVKHGGLVEALVDELIWTREAETLPTVITTNLTQDELRAKLSDRLVDRLRGEWGWLYAVSGPSERLGPPAPAP